MWNLTKFAKNSQVKGSEICALNLGSNVKGV